MENTNKVKDQEASALLFAWVLAAMAIGVLAWIAYARLHLHPDQVVEMCVYAVIAVMFLIDIVRHYSSKATRRKEVWPPPTPAVPAAVVEKESATAATTDSVLVGHETDGKPFYWTDLQRSWQTITTGQSGSGKSTFIETILQQDIERGTPIIFIDGKGEKKLLDKILPCIEASGRMKDLRLVDTTQSSVSSCFNPLWTPHGDPILRASHVFESFKKEGGDDFFDKHQRVYLENIVRILYYTGEHYNFNDVLVCAYVKETLLQMMRLAYGRAKASEVITPNQLRNLEMSMHHILTTFEDKERVSKIQGLVNEMLTFLGDAMQAVTGPYDRLISMDDVLDKNMILYVSLNVNLSPVAAVSLGRIILQSLQLAIGERYAATGYGTTHKFASVVMDEFAPFAYENFSNILQQARGANVGFLYALQTYAQLDTIGPGMRDSLSTGPNCSFMLRMRDNSTADQYRGEGGELKTDRLSVQVEKKGILSGGQYEERGLGSRSQAYETVITDEMLKRLPNGQMQALMSDPVRGLVHKHVHVQLPVEHYLMNGLNNLYPRLLTPKRFNGGLNLLLPPLDLSDGQQQPKRKELRKGTR